jgi:hypothetical protein
MKTKIRKGLLQLLLIGLAMVSCFAQGTMEKETVGMNGPVV